MLYGYLLRSRGIEFTFPDIIQQIGLLLFIFTIGMQAGPSFFEVFKSQGVRLIILAGLTLLIDAITSAILCYSFNIDPTISVGLFTGALTSTPGLAAGIDASGSPLASIRNCLSLWSAGSGVFCKTCSEDIRGQHCAGGGKICGRSPCSNPAGYPQKLHSYQ